MYIILDTSDETRHREPPSGQRTSQQSPDDGRSTSQPVASLEDQVEYLRHELDIRNEELRRKDHLFAAALERIPAIEAPSDEPTEPRESAVSDSEDTPKGAAPQDQADGEIKRSWWQRLFRTESTP